MDRQPSDLNLQGATERYGPGDDRGRDSLFLMASFSTPDMAAPLNVRVRNLSEGGLMAELAAPLDVGLPVTLLLRGIGEVTGRVAWFAEGRAGIAFDMPIDPRRARKPVGQGGRTPNYAKPITYGR